MRSDPAFNQVTTMGNKESTKKPSKDKGFIEVTATTCPSDVQFNAANSRAVCIGVGRSVHMQRQSHDVPMCDRDAKIVNDAMEKELGFPSQLLASDSYYSATKANVLHCFTKAAKEVESDGILFIFFSGPATRYAETQIGLANSDFNGDAAQLITCDEIVKALGELKSTRSRIIAMFDCRLAAALAQTLVVRIGADYSAHFVVACSTPEKSLFADELGSGAFAYFLVCYLKTITEKGMMNVDALTKYCMSRCRALADLVLQRDDAADQSAYMDPKHISSIELTWHEIDGGLRVRSVPSGDETDSGRRAVSYERCFDYLDYQDESALKVDNEWSKKIVGWLSQKVEPQLRILREHLGDERLRRTVIGLVMRSAGLLIGWHKPELATEPNTFMLSAFRVKETMIAVLGESENDQVTFYADLRYYMLGVAVAVRKEIGELIRLIDFGKRLIRDEGGDERDAVRIAWSLSRTPV